MASLTGVSDKPSLFSCKCVPGGLWLQQLGSGNTNLELPDFQSVCFHSLTAPPRKQGIQFKSKVGGLVLFSFVRLVFHLLCCPLEMKILRCQSQMNLKFMSICQLPLSEEPLIHLFTHILILCVVSSCASHVPSSRSEFEILT